MMYLETDRKRALTLLKIAVGYTSVEALASIMVALGSSLISLLGFGLDSLIEVIAALLVLQHFTIEMRDGKINEDREKKVLRVIALTFFALAAYLVIQGIRALLYNSVPEQNGLGLIVTGVSAAVMFWLSRRMKSSGARMRSRLLIANAAESKLCGILALTTLIGLATFRLFGWTWIDPFTGMIVALFALNEGREAWEGELFCDEVE